MGMDAARELADDAPDRRATADSDLERTTAAPKERTEMRPPSAAERIDARREAQLAADKAYAKLIGEEISSGHAFDKHVIERGEFPGVTTRREFAELIEDAVMNGESRVLSRARTAYWSDGTVVIRDPSTADGGTAFRPANGYDYFLGLH